MATVKLRASRVLGFGTLSMLVGLVLLVVSVRLTTPRHALFIGLSVPVNGAGIALDQGASAPNTVLGFAILVAVGVSAWGVGAHRTAIQSVLAPDEFDPLMSRGCAGPGTLRPA